MGYTQCNVKLIVTFGGLPMAGVGGESDWNSSKMTLLLLLLGLPSATGWWLYKLTRGLACVFHLYPTLVYSGTSE